jgi:hypothetical protein
MVNQLQELLRQYVDGELNYEAFYAAFVDEFLSKHHDEVIVDDLVNEVASECADLDEGDISEDDLRGELDIIANTPVVSIEWTDERGGKSVVNLPVSRVPIVRENGTNPSYASVVSLVA